MPTRNYKPENTRPSLPIETHPLFRLTAESRHINSDELGLVHLLAALAREAAFKYLDIIAPDVEPVKRAVGNQEPQGPSA